MAEGPLFYYVTDRAAFPGDERARRMRLLDKIAEAASQGVNYIQFREKDLCTCELESLAREAMLILRKLRPDSEKSATSLLINSRSDVAMAIAADGVHLPAEDVSPAEVRLAWKRRAGFSGRSDRPPADEDSPRDLIVSVSCHSPEEVARAATNHATLAIFAPIFEKKDMPGTNAAGLDALHEGCRARLPVLALGGITLQNADSCLRAGAAGIAAIRLFQENDIGTVVRELRG
ncbi:MAG: thiamine phosphate synthase [Candidatus Sulfotelmatobacter sp.]